MPHCPRSLYEQLLERNNDTLENILLLSNQLNLYAERYVTTMLSHMVLAGRSMSQIDRELRSEVLKKIPYLQKLGMIAMPAALYVAYAHPYYQDLRSQPWCSRSTKIGQKPLTIWLGKAGKALEAMTQQQRNENRFARSTKNVWPKVDKEKKVGSNPPLLKHLYIQYVNSGIERSFASDAEPGIILEVD